jgi:beta-glucanase (GH16 family)
VERRRPPAPTVDLSGEQAKQGAHAMRVDWAPATSPYFEWSGHLWQARDNELFGHGDPAHNGQWSTDNVRVTEDGYLSVRVSNPTGESPVSGQAVTVGPSFGYGTYECVVDGRVDLMHSNAVFGGMYTFDHGNGPDYTEIDMCEASAWGGVNPIRMQHGYWHSSGSMSKEDFVMPAVQVHAHRCLWEPGKLTFWSFEDELDGTLIKQTTLTAGTVPVPSANNQININVWTHGGSPGNPQFVPDTEMIIRSFSYTSL